MRAETAASLFAADAEHLLRYTGFYRIRNARILGPLRLFYEVKHRGKTYAVVITGSPKYYVLPTDVKFCDPNNPDDTDPKWWPTTASGIGAAQQLVCFPGVQSGHKSHPPWPITTGKNRLEAITMTLCHQVLAAEA